MKKSSDETKDKIGKDADKMGDSHKKNSEKAEKSWKSSFSAIGSVAGKAVGIAATGISAAVTAGATATAALVKSAVDSYAEYEQLVGGVETLFKDSSNTVMNYADNAYKTAGLSANAYMETVTSFSASLLQSLDNDTAAAAEKADLAITDMSDNANKMGTSMEFIQNAYQGFAKQNYTMLDNLKLGYGGTKEEMQRLLEDAEAISGIEYDISSYADIVDAIHVIQEEMGIAGTTAKEASTTIEGSMNAAKSAWSNLVIGIADDSQDFDALVDNFVDSVAVAAENILPRVETAITGVGTLIESLLPVVMDEIPGLINDVLPKLLDCGAGMVESITNGLSQNAAQISQCAVDIVTTIVQVMISMMPQILEMGLILIENLAAGLDSAAPSIVSGALTVITTLVQSLISLAPQLLNVALSLIQTLATGLGSSLPTLLPAAVDVIVELVDTLVSNADMIVDGAIALILGLADGLVVALPKLIAAVPRIIQSLVQAIINNAPKLLVAALQLVLTLAQGIISSDFTIVSSVLDLINRVKETFLNTDWKSLGKNIVDGAVQGVSQFASNLINQVGDLAKQVFNKFKSTLDINSPSRKFKWLGQMSVAGYDEALQEYDPYVAFSNRLQSTGAVLRANFVGSVGSADSSQIEFDYKEFGKATAEAIEDSGLTITVGDKVLGRIIRRYV